MTYHNAGSPVRNRVSLAGYQWDLSNLCDDHRYCVSRPEPSLYPSLEEMTMDSIHNVFDDDFQDTKRVSDTEKPLLDYCYSSPEKRSTSWQRTSVEIAPGHYMDLRGAEETAQAIESGRSARVMCFYCGADLQCVSDCELVICPDCRTMSPVKKKVVVRKREYRHSMPTRKLGLPTCDSLWLDDDDSFGESASDPGDHTNTTAFVGGVGLGVRI